MPTLLLVSAGREAAIMTSIGAVNVSAVTPPAKTKRLPAILEDAKNLPEIVHSRAHRRELGHPEGLVRQRFCRTRPLAATQGSEVGLRALLFGAVVGIVRCPAHQGQLPHRSNGPSLQ